MRWNLAIVAFVAALGVAALVDGIRGGGQGSEPAAATAVAEADELRGPDVPAPGALPGVLVVTRPGDCRLREIDLARAAFRRAGPETLCEAWAAPAGGFAVAQTERTVVPGARRIALVRLGDPPERERDLGVARGAVAWSADGARAAWCGPGGSSTVLTVATGEQDTVAGCSPRFAPDGSVLTLATGAQSAELLRDGNAELDEADLAAGFGRAAGGPINVLEFDVSEKGRIALAASRPDPAGEERVLELWLDGRLEESVELPAQVGPAGGRLGELLRFGPGGRELAVGYGPGPGPLTIVDLGTGRLALRSAEQRAFAWSPDGEWLALATAAGEIRIYGALRDVPAYVLPVGAATLDWAKEQEPPARE